MTTLSDNCSTHPANHSGSNDHNHDPRKSTMEYRLVAYRSLNQKIHDLERTATPHTLRDRLTEIFAVTEHAKDREGNPIEVRVAKTVDIWGGGKFIGTTSSQRVSHDHVQVDGGTDATNPTRIDFAPTLSIVQ